MTPKIQHFIHRFSLSILKGRAEGKGGKASNLEHIYPDSSGLCVFFLTVRATTRTGSYVIDLHDPNGKWEVGFL